MQEKPSVVTWVERGFLSRQDFRRQGREQDKQPLPRTYGPNRAARRSNGKRLRVQTKRDAYASAYKNLRLLRKDNERIVQARDRGV